MTTIYFTRHGETEWNREFRFQGKLNSELTELGILAAELLSERFEEIEIDKIISSPLKRAYHTAEIIKGNKHIDIIKIPGFQEINLGDFEGMQYSEIKTKYYEILKRIEDDPFTNAYPNGENLIDFYNRVEKAFKDVIDENRGKKVLIVAHGGTIKCIESLVRKVKLTKNWMSTVVKNCSLSCIEVDDNNNIKELFFNDIEHLKGRLAFN